MKNFGHYMLAICALAAWAGLVSCDGEPSAEKAGKKVDQAVERTAEAIEEGEEKVKEAGEAAVEKTNDVIEEGANAVSEAVNATVEKAKEVEKTVAESTERSAQKVKDIGK